MDVVDICDKLFILENFNKYCEDFNVKEGDIEIGLSRNESFLLEDFFRHLNETLLQSYFAINSYNDVAMGSFISFGPAMLLKDNQHLRWFCEIGARIKWNLSTGKLLLNPKDQKNLYGLIRFMETEYDDLLEYQKTWESKNLKFWEAFIGLGFVKPRGLNGRECLSQLKQKLIEG